MSRRSLFFSALLSVGAGAVLVNISRLLAVIIATRYLTVDEMGVYFLFMIAISVLTAISSFGMNISLVKFINEKDTNELKFQIISTGFTSYLIILLFTLLISVIINHYLHFVDIPCGGVLLFLSTAVFNQMNVIFQGLKEFKVISFSNGINSISKLVLVLFFLPLFNLGFKGLILALAASNCIAVIFQVYSFHSKFSFKNMLYINFHTLKEILHFSVPIYLNQLYSLLYSKGYSIMLAVMLGPSSVAYFNIATRIPNSIQQVRQIYLTVFFPTIMDLIKSKFEKAILLLKVSIDVALTFIIFGTALLLPFREEVMRFIFSEKYIACSLAAFIMLFRCIFTVCSPIMGQTLIALGKNKAPLHVNFIVTTIAFSMTYMLIPAMGYMAAVYVSLLASAIGFLLNWLLLKKAGMVIKIWFRFIVMTSIFLIYTGVIFTQHDFYKAVCIASLTIAILISILQISKSAGFSFSIKKGLF